MKGSSFIGNAQTGRDSYTDLSSVQAIRAIKDKGQALEQVAQQFESMMLRMMMKSMRDANEVFSEGNFLSSHETETYQGMLDDQLALSLSQDGGMGVAEVLVRQLSTSFGALPASDASSANSFSDYLEKRHSGQEQAPVSEAIAVPGPLSWSPVDESAIDFDGTIEKFVDALYPYADKAAKKLGVEPEVLIAQSALETGWGRKVNTHGNGDSSFNFFNIKADQRWQGNAVSVSTLEYRDGVPVRERANFRAYSSTRHGFEDYVNFVGTSERYRKALECSDGESYIRELAEAGYATDKEYADKIIRILNSPSLRTAIENAASQSGAED